MASRQGGHASPWRHRKGLRRTVQGRRHAERNNSRTEANRPRGAAEPSRTRRHASCASPSFAKAGAHDNCAPLPAPAQQPSSSKDGATLEAGQFADEASAKARCPADTVVWVNLPSKIYHFAGTRSYGTTKHGAYMCEKEAIAAERSRLKNRKASLRQNPKT